MNDYLERYKAGHYEQVWDELMAMGSSVRAQPYYDQALEVALETMCRVRYNCELLIAKLEKLGWQFKPLPWWPEALIQMQPPRLGAPVSSKRLDQLDAKFGPLPLSLRAFYEVVGTINFVGMPFERPGWPDIQDDLDPLYIAGLETNFENKQPYWPEDEVTDEFRREVIIAPDFLLKYGYAGVGCEVIRLPESGIDAPIFFDENETPNKYNNQDVTLVRYLRLAFKYGGFRSFAWKEQDQLPKADLAFLSEGLLDI